MIPPFSSTDSAARLMALLTSDFLVNFNYYIEKEFKKIFEYFLTLCNTLKITDISYRGIV